jgi:hypothetical protein
LGEAEAGCEKGGLNVSSGRDRVTEFSEQQQRPVESHAKLKVILDEIAERRGDAP